MEFNQSRNSRTKWPTFDFHNKDKKKKRERSHLTKGKENADFVQLTHQLLPKTIQRREKEIPVSCTSSLEHIHHHYSLLHFNQSHFIQIMSTIEVSDKSDSLTSSQSLEWLAISFDSRLLSSFSVIFWEDKSLPDQSLLFLLFFTNYYSNWIKGWFSWVISVLESQTNDLDLQPKILFMILESSSIDFSVFQANLCICILWEFSLRVSCV